MGCVAGDAPLIDDGIDCTADSCDPRTGIVIHNPINDFCDDYLACTGEETCNPLSGCVAGIAVDCPDDGWSCSIEKCVEPLGNCERDFSGCDCEPGDACDDGKQCTDDECVDGFCSNVPDATNTCSDNDACTINDRCSEESCIGDINPLIDDGVGCTIDVCNSVTGEIVHILNHDFCSSNAGQCVDVNLQPGKYWTGQCTLIGCGIGIKPDETLCDGVDNDCDNRVDEGLTNRYYRDADEDNHGDASDFVDVCGDAPAGYVLDDTDCDDSDEDVFLGHIELCDDKDNDCDNEVDEGDTCLAAYYCDVDGDGEISSTITGSCSSFGCVPYGCQRDAGEDCDDSNKLIFPGAEEICNRKDDNCDGRVDEGVTTIYYIDEDGDGFGAEDMLVTIEACSRPIGYADNHEDCDDRVGIGEDVHPGAREECDGIDNNCADGIDEGDDKIEYMYQIGKSLPSSIILFTVVTILSMFFFHGMSPV